MQTELNFIDCEKMKLDMDNDNPFLIVSNSKLQIELMNILPAGMLN